jgi:hypothetical protein
LKLLSVHAASRVGGAENPREPHNFAKVSKKGERPKLPVTRFAKEACIIIMTEETSAAQGLATLATVLRNCYNGQDGEKETRDQTKSQQPSHASKRQKGGDQKKKPHYKTWGLVFYPYSSQDF